MTHKEKVKLYLALFARDEPAKRAIPWWPWKGLWRVGIKLAPPEFLSPTVNFILFMLCFALFWFLTALVAIFTGTVPGTLFTDVVHGTFKWFLLFLSTTASAVIAFLMDAWASKHGYGRWPEFGGLAGDHVDHHNKGGS